MKAWHWKQITSESFTQKWICGCEIVLESHIIFLKLRIVSAAIHVSHFFPFPRLVRVRTRKVGEHPVISSSLNRFCPQVVTWHVVFFSDQLILSTQKTHLASWQWDLHIKGLVCFPCLESEFVLDCFICLSSWLNSGADLIFCLRWRWSWWVTQRKIHCRC